MLYTKNKLDSLVKKMAPIALKIERQFSSGVAIYGAGFLGTWSHTYLKSVGAQVRHFIDRDEKKIGTVIQGIPVISPEDPSVASVPSIFISARHAVRSVQTAFSTMKLKMISFDGYYVIRNYEKMAFIRDNYLHDNKSIETYNAILIAMLTGSVESCRAVMVKDMYFALPEFSGTFDEIFVDAGAFVGDSVERFIWENLGTFRHIYAFEPGRKQFSALERRIRRLSKEWAFDADTVTMVRAGLGAESGRMEFSFTEDSSLRHGLMAKDLKTASEAIDDSEVHSLDSFLDGRPATFLKADIEGMEMDFLRGAQSTICRYKPKMAICVYHYPSDLIDVAEFIHGLVPEYTFYIRQHAPIFGDFVLYCSCDSLQ